MALLLTATAFPSCGKKEETKITNVFKETKFVMPEEYSGDNFNIGDLYSAGEMIYAMCYKYDEKTYESRQFFLPLNLDGTVGEEIPIDIKSEENGGMYYQSAAFADDGTFWMALNVYEYDEETGYQDYTLIRHYATPGAAEYDVIDLRDYIDDNNFYLNYLISTADGKLIVGNWETLKLIDPNGGVKDFKNDDGEEYQNVQRLGDKIYASIYRYDSTAGTGESKLVELNTETMEFGDEHTVPYNARYNMIVGPGYDFYYNDGTAVWASNLDSEESVEIMNFINSDIDGSNIYTLIPLSADKFFAMGYDEENYNTRCMIFDRIPDEEVAERELITLATARLSYTFRNQIINFNKSNDKYRIVVKDYSSYATEDNYNAGADRLTTDLTAGELPDLIDITNELPYDSLASKNLFADLYELMDGDESFDRSAYFDNIFKACENDGKLYTLIPTFRLMTFSAKTSNLEGMKTWNIDDFMKFAKEHPDIQIFDYDFTRAQFLEYILYYTRDNFIDRTTGECRFNSDEFKKLLEFASTLTTDEFWDSIDYDEVGEDFWMEYEERFTENKVLLSQSYFYSLSSSYRSIVNYTFKNPVTMIGFPSNEGNGAGISPISELAITNRSKHKDGAWEFLKSLISEDALMPTETKWGWDYGNGIPILRKAVEKQLEIGMIPPETNYGSVDGDETIIVGRTDSAETEAVVDESEGAVDYNGDGVIDEDDVPAAETDEVENVSGVVIEDSVAVDVVVGPSNNNSSYRIDCLSQEQADDLLALIEGVTQIIREDEKLTAIITEEAESYFSGQKSLDTVVDIIQNRAETYIAESR